MDDAVRTALENERVIDITTKGRKTGRSHRIEIWFQNIDGQLYIMGAPGRRDWFANMIASPEFTFHLKRGIMVDLPARAAPIRDVAKRREVFRKIHTRLEGEGIGGLAREDEWVESSPLVHVEITAS